MVEGARLSSGKVLVEEFFESLAGRKFRDGLRRVSGMDLLAAIALRFEDLARTGTLPIPRELNELRSDIWEIKAERVRLPFYWTQIPFASRAIRLTHGFIKATAKTPRKEIDCAIWVRKEDLK
ncbi:MULTISPECIES: type II toxin-antitoxin system RelE/ParE family toxin [unclassified Solwaraspora]|uniref:type II toxin-antitoxin system RelE/ParE family toxin n=1 Tax=unclassified Solwaraspora TaxID=2627926 RepID=UPI00259BE96D|nr:type II toxin-antitoxin system RelE/ParE family toxin [Solwaraspora sp. WMMA2056]WJK41408.1 type II toxin-antitoxin system RelE/ParE family toxin [Solwaraspora sp. WMMA2056]